MSTSPKIRYRIPQRVVQACSRQTIVFLFTLQLFITLVIHACISRGSIEGPMSIPLDTLNLPDVVSSYFKLLPSYLSEIVDRGNGQGCRYDGHCPIGMTCGVPVLTAAASTTTVGHQSQNWEEEQLPGECLSVPILIRRGTSFYDEDNKEDDAYLKDCQHACQAELEMDEHFFQESWPKIIGPAQRTSSLTRPKGCVLDYIRQVDNTEHWKALHANDGKVPKTQPEPSIITWEQTRFRHLVRVDPVVKTVSNSGTSNDNVSSTNNSSGMDEHPQQQVPQQHWRAYCTAPCKSNMDCQTSSTRHIVDDSKRPWQCVDGACQRNPTYWNVRPELLRVKQESNNSTNRYPPSHQGRRHEEMVIVTAATKSFFGGLRNLVASVRYWAPNHSVVVYNLGDLNDVFDVIRSWDNVLATEWFEEGGIPTYYPNQVRNSKTYAWKPIIIKEALKKYGMILWLDAGSTLMGPITPIVNIVKRNGIFLVKGQDEDMKPKSLPETYKWFGLDKETFPDKRPHYSGNTQAYLYPSRFFHKIVERNAACAMVQSCIAPSGSSKKTHRFDQTSLSLCAYDPAVRAPHHTEYLAAHWNQVNLANKLFESSYRMIWTARSSCERCYTNETENYLQKGVVPVDWIHHNRSKQ